jgi:hypothetical protein
MLLSGWVSFAGFVHGVNPRAWLKELSVKLEASVDYAAG